MEKTIILNQIKTPDGTVICSMYRHDYVTHLDANGLEYMVDGGSDYLRRNLHESAPYEELTVYSDAPFKVIRESFHRGGRGKDGTQPLSWVPMSKMSDSWLFNCIKYNEERGQDACFANDMYREELMYRKEKEITIEDAD